MSYNKEELFQERFRIFISWINLGNIPIKNKLITFKEADASYSDEYPNASMFSWFSRNIYSNNFYPLIKKELEKYISIYPNGYQYIHSFIERMDSKLSNSVKMDIFMKYINDWNNKIPTGRDSLKFSDISLNNQTKVGVWLQGRLADDEHGLIEDVSRYKYIYPCAYHKMYWKLFSRNTDAVMIYRISVLLSFLSKYAFTNEDKFCDIGGHPCDTTKVSTWYQSMKGNPQNMETIKKYCALFGHDLSSFLQVRNEGAKNITMQERARVELFLYYLENHDFPVTQESFSFSSIASDVDDDSIVINWFARNYYKYGKSFIDEFSQWETIYPVGYQKLVNAVFEKRSSKNCRYEQRLELILRYLENNDIPSSQKITFHDIDDSVEYTGVINFWIANQFASNEVKLMEMLEEYKDIYPNGYSKIRKILHIKELIRKFDKK